ncbi:hypothetical protein [Bacillus sp. UNC322MFChir4.1]|uniref:hypothetical protein n=1 Tax=Bacillus sp. UNC322MFChir4.1 TaxID=1449045 RepID=UPI0005558F3A|nr:hypothetical protein [Bacillus sp. UNC322MFChir4.1]
MKVIKNVILLAVCFLFLSGCNYENEKEVKTYFKEKYGIDVIVTDWEEIHSGNMGHVYHTVQVKDNKHIQFRVEVDGLFYSTIIGDEYKDGKNAYEAYEKFKPILKEIEKLGFSEPEDENTIQYITDHIEEYLNNNLLLTLKMNNKIDYSQFESTELDRFFALLQLIQRNNKKIAELNIKDNTGEYTRFYYTNIQKNPTKEELLLAMKNASPDYWTYLIQTQVHDKIKEIQNERFIFKEITCSYTKNGDCPAYNVTLDFNDGMLQYKNNPNLIEDLIKVATWIKEELHNKQFNINLTYKGGTKWEGRMSSEDMEKRNSVEDYMKEYFREK